MITQKSFGKTADGREVLAFTIGDEYGRAVILDYGGTVQSLIVPDKTGKPVDVVLGYDDMAGYEQNGGYLGALIGRFCNRIGEGKLTIDGKLYPLYINDRGNHLHGGKVGFDKKIWAHEIVGDELRLTLFSPDGEENYPGNLTVNVTYTFSKGEFRISYRSVSDRKTAVNFTNHAYFNLSGTDSALGDILSIDADRILPTSPSMIPEGAFRAVEGTPFDFRTPKPIGRDVEQEDEDLLRGNGYDHTFVLNKPLGAYAKFAVAESPVTGVRMECYTDAPIVQFYSGNGLKQCGKGGKHYAKRAAYCLETSMIPNNVNVPAYAALGSSIIEAGQVYETVTAYRFTK